MPAAAPCFSYTLLAAARRGAAESAVEVNKQYTSLSSPYPRTGTTTFNYKLWLAAVCGCHHDAQNKGRRIRPVIRGSSSAQRSSHHSMARVTIKAEWPSTSSTLTAAESSSRQQPGLQHGQADQPLHPTQHPAWSPSLLGLTSAAALDPKP